jgi:hypothetical protein
MHESFHFSKIIATASPILHQWAIENDVFLFDYDEFHWSTDRKNQISIAADEIKGGGYRFVAMCESHPFFNTEERYADNQKIIESIFAAISLPVVWLTADWRLWHSGNTNNRTFFPAWYFRLRDHAVNNQYYNYPIPTERKYNFSCCNFSNLRSEKLFNYIECYKRKRSDWYLTIYNHPTWCEAPYDISNRTGIPLEHRILWQDEIRPKIKDYSYDLLNGEYQNLAYSTIHPGHIDAYCNLVMEHSMEIEIASEKTFKPFIAEQIPIFLGAIGIAKFVESLGFDIFRDFVDHDAYDISDYYYIDRITAVHQEIDRIYATDNWQTFFNRPDVVARKLKNKYHFYSDHIDHMTVLHLDRMLDK